MDDGLLRIASVGLCTVTIAPSMIEHFNAGFGFFATKISQKGEATESYYGTLLYYVLSCSEHTRGVFGYVGVSGSEC